MRGSHRCCRLRPDRTDSVELALNLRGATAAYERYTFDDLKKHLSNRCEECVDCLGVTNGD